MLAGEEPRVASADEKENAAKLGVVGIANGDDLGLCARWEPPELTDRFTVDVVLTILEHLKGPHLRRRRSRRMIGPARSSQGENGMTCRI